MTTLQSNARKSLPVPITLRTLNRAVCGDHPKEKGVSIGPTLYGSDIESVRGTRVNNRTTAHQYSIDNNIRGSR